MNERERELRERDQLRERMVISGEPQHFILVHGVCHGAWCWFKVRHLLEKSGHKVTCVDLASAGANRSDPNSILTIQQYDKPLFDLFSALPADEKVVLVGHSAGGLSITHAMHEFQEKIAVAIFVAATMLPFGFRSEEDIQNGTPQLSEYGDVYEANFALGIDHPPTSVLLREEFQRKILYNLSPEEDSTLASMLLRPCPIRALQSAKLEGAEEDINRVRRVYIKTMCDHMVKPEQQEAMIRRWPPSEVLVIETDHSPFFSDPSLLIKLMVKATSE